MAVSDPIADFLTRIRNSIKARHRYVDMGWSKLKQSIAEIMKQQGLIENYLVNIENQRGTMRIFLKYTDGRQPVIQGLKRMSKPGLRQYIKHTDIPNFYGGLGIPVLSTSQGVIDGKNARHRKIGGELLCLIW